MGGVGALWLVLLIAGCPGCVESRFGQRVADAERKVYLERDALEESAQKKGRRLDWKTACKLLDAGNPTLRQARNTHAQIERDRKRFAIDQFSPRIAALANLSSALGSLSELKDDNYGIRLYGTFIIPNPLASYARRYSLELQYYQSALSAHEMERRLQANLYGRFLMYAHATETTSTLEPQTATNASWFGLLEKEIAETRSSVNERDKLRNLRIVLNQLLNTPGENWIPDAGTLPDISYEGKLARLDPKRGYGLLAVKQAAGQIEASLANLWRVKMDKLPSFSIGISIPTLYDSRLDEDGFNVQETRLFGSLNKSYDFTGSRRESATRAEERARYVQENLRLRLEREIYQLDRAKENYKLLVRERDAMQKSLRWMRRNPPPGSSSEVLMKRLRDELSMRSRLGRNELQRKQMDLEFWIWDESYWTSPF